MPTLAISTRINSLLLFVVEAVSSLDGDTATCAEVYYQDTVAATVAAITTITRNTSSRNNNTTKQTATLTSTAAATKTNAATATLLHKLVVLNVRQCY